MPPESTPAPSIGKAAFESRPAAAPTPEPARRQVAGVDLEKDLGQYDLLDDCRMMLRFAVKEGIEPDESLRKDIAALDAILAKAGKDTISEVPRELLEPPSDAGASRPEIIR